MKRALHLLAHLLGLNRGHAGLIKKAGRYYSCFRCDCGKTQCVREMTYLEAVRWARDYSDRWEIGAGPARRA